MMITMRGPVMLLMLFLFYHGSNADTRYYIKLNNDDVKKTVPSDTTINYDSKDEKSRAIFNLDDESMIRDTLKANHERRNSFHETSTFDPDVLNKFLDEYANKMKSTTERSDYPYSFAVTTKKPVVTSVEIVDGGNMDASTSTEDTVTINDAEISLETIQATNDTTKRNKYYNTNSNDDRNGGWVTLEAIPWSKSKISKWQANPSSQQPWPDTKWDKPITSKPRPTEQSRPYYENTKPWYDKPTSHWSDYKFERPKPISSMRPSYSNNRYDTNSNHAEKWPPEKPEHSSWHDYSRPNSDIITDDSPSNFPTNNWDRYDQVTRPGYSSFNDRFSDQHNEATNDWPGLNYPSNKYEHVQEKPSFMRPDNQRPYFSGQYEYESHYRPSHPSSGDGEWILLSTNRGYSKSRQRSIQFDTANNGALTPLVTNSTLTKLTKDKGTDSVIPVMTSKRQVRLTVLPSINGTNTTTSHGGLLEVEKTFKTVEESQREHEQLVKFNSSNHNIGNLNPIRQTALRRPSNTAVLAAVGAGMLPATMAMVLPMMLGRKKRSPRAAIVDTDGWKYLEKLD